MVATIDQARSNCPSESACNNNYNSSNSNNEHRKIHWRPVPGIARAKRITVFYGRNAETFCIKDNVILVRICVFKNTKTSKGHIEFDRKVVLKSKIPAPPEICYRSENKRKVRIQPIPLFFSLYTFRGAKNVSPIKSRRAWKISHEKRRRSFAFYRCRWGSIIKTVNNISSGRLARACVRVVESRDSTRQTSELRGRGQRISWINQPWRNFQLPAAHRQIMAIFWA